MSDKKNEKSQLESSGDLLPGTLDDTESEDHGTAGEVSDPNRRRLLLKTLPVGGGLAAGAAWQRPIVQAAQLPIHAQATQIITSAIA